MYIHNINPIAFSLGPLHVYWYGLVYAVAFILTYIYLYVQIQNKKFKLTISQLDSLFIHLILGVLIGGRVGEYIFWQPQTLIHDPISILYIWQGGMAFHGAVIGVALALYLFCRKYNIHFYDISDRLVIPASLAIAVGRVANFINGELPGTITTANIGVNFRGELDVQGNRVFRHPVQLYAALKDLLMAGILYLEDKRTEHKQGYLTWLFIFIYGILRTIVNFWREDVRWLLGIFSTGQVLSILMIIIATYMLYTRYWKK